MTSLSLSHFLTIPLVEEDQHQTPVPPLTLPLGTSNSPPIFFDPLQSYAEGGSDCHLRRERKLEVHGSSDCPQALPNHTDSNSYINEGSASHQFTREGKQQQQGSRRKTMKIPDRTHVIKKPRRRNRRSFLDQEEQESSNGDSTAGTVRVCSDCNTTTTPLWRTGPSGPKSLCNACGIRQRKARRAAAAAAVLSGGLIPAISITRSVCTKKKILSGADLGKKHCFNDIVVRLGRSSAFRQVFPQDETDAAILLMALSCGLILS